MVVLLDHPLHLLLEDLLVLQHDLILHDVVLCIGCHCFDIVPVGRAHLLAPLQVALLLGGAKSLRDFV